MSYQSWNTSSAYKLEEAKREVRQQETHRKPNQRKKVDEKAVFVRKVKKYAMIATVLVMAFVIVRGYVAIDEASGNITTLKKNYNSVVAENQAIQAEIDRTLDLEELQRVATEEYGMTRPERYQIYYIDMGFGDSGMVVADSEGENDEQPLKGASGMIVDSMNIYE